MNHSSQDGVSNHEDTLLGFPMFERQGLDMSHVILQATETDALSSSDPAVASSSRAPYPSTEFASPSATISSSDNDDIEKTTNLDYRPLDPSHAPECDTLYEDGLSLYEKKCVLINQEIDQMGMGRYQWSLWTLCGLGYMIDLMWAQAFGLILSPLQQELGFGPEQTGKLSTAFSIGLTAGAFVWGVLVDVIGRQWAFNLTVLIACAFGLCIAVPSTYTTILVFTAITGFGVGGNIPIDTTITLEFTPHNKRYLLPLLSIFQPIGVVICVSLSERNYI